MKAKPDPRVKGKRLYWYPNGIHKPPRYEINAALRHYRRGDFSPEVKAKFEAFMDKLIEAWKQIPEG